MKKSRKVRAHRRLRGAEVACIIKGTHSVAEESAPIVELAEWFQTPPGQYVLRWEQAQFDAVVADVFGYNALQVGLAELEPAAR